MKNNIRVGSKVRITKRRTGQQKGNAYTVLAISGNKATLRPGVHGVEKQFDLRDIS